ncbi:ribonuclease domain-containing protein [Streptomyces sp. T028]|uniref:ribonuclease domain-containing protein n=1 Tax=Streptomyces sp. T028 TaxID=3394379 RepID=UPI003A88E83E
MSSTLVEASAPDAERRKTPRLRGRRRILTVASVLLALVGGAVAESGTALASTPPGTCTQTCNNPPGGVSRAEWNGVLQAASFWANHYIDFNAVVGYRSGLRFHNYYRLDTWAGHGWPHAGFGRQWYAYWDNRTRRNQFLYYGGTFNDRSGLISTIEQARGVPASRAFSTDRRRTAPYVEYDVDYWDHPWGTPDRGARRFVRNPNSGNVYYTNDHYRSFYYVGRF